MSLTVDFTPRFTKTANKLARRRRTLQAQITKLKQDLQNGRRPGDRLQGVGAVVYKARLSNPGTKEGQRGGFRVAYLVRKDHITLLAICKKPKCADLEPVQIRRLLKQLGLYQ